jgi:hypothetical protein
MMHTGMIISNQLNKIQKSIGYRSDFCARKPLHSSLLITAACGFDGQKKQQQPKIRANLSCYYETNN